MLQIEQNGPTWLRLTFELATVRPEDALQWFLQPPLLAQWWTPQTTVEPVAGGRWEMGFPQIGATLTGEIAELTPTMLVASWVFDSEPDLPARTLVVQAEPSADGTRLRIVQGPYRQGESFPREDEDRASHIEGWRFFLPRLADAIS